MNIPTVSELVASTDISKSYASEIRSGARKPSRALAIHIFRKTGWRHSILAGLSDVDIETLERIEQWKPSRKKASAQESAA